MRIPRNASADIIAQTQENVNTFFEIFLQIMVEKHRNDAGKHAASPRRLPPISVVEKKGENGELFLKRLEPSAVLGGRELLVRRAQPLRLERFAEQI